MSVRRAPAGWLANTLLQAQGSEPMTARVIEALYVIAYVLVAPILIWLFDLGALAWLIYASTLAVASTISISQAVLRMKLQGTLN